MQPVSPHKWQEGLLRHSILLMLATQVGNVANLLFQFVMMRALTPAEYGVLATMLSLILILGTPLEALRTAVAHQTSLLVRADVPGDTRRLIGRWRRGLLAVAAVILLAGLFGRGALQDFFHLDSSLPLIVATVVMAMTLFMPLFIGVLQGLQAFIWMSVAGQSWGIVRLLAGAALVYLVSRSALSGLIGQGIGVIVSISLGGFAAWFILRRAPGSDEIRIGGLSYFIRSLLVLGGFAVLMNADIALVKRYFDAEQAGLFAKCATMARMIVFLPLPIAGAMFPKVVSMGRATDADRRILWRAIGYTALVIAGAALFFSLAAPWIWRFFTGADPDSELVLLLRWMMWALAPLGLTSLLINYELAQHRFRLAYISIPLALLYVAGVSVRHSTLGEVVAILASASVASMAILAIGVAWGARRANR